MKNTFIWICRILLGLVSLVLIFQGFMWAFLPANNLEMNNIVAHSVLGLNMIKSDIGGALMAVGLIQLLYAINQNEFYLPLVIVVSGYLVVRTVSFFVDGSHPTIITGIILEAIVLLLVIALNQLRKQVA